MGRLLVLSPHLDDAVFACGELIASHSDTTVATLFAGAPASNAALTDWDRDAGFLPGDDVIAFRRAEDRAALEALGAKPLWLEFTDDQYGEAPAMGALVAALRAVLERENPDSVLFPAGLFHADHRRTHDAMLFAIDASASREWCLYEDVFYRRIDGLLDARLKLLDAVGLAPKPISFPVSRSARERKRTAIACYRSQLKALATRSGHDDAFGPERYWRISVRNRGT